MGGAPAYWELPLRVAWVAPQLTLGGPPAELVAVGELELSQHGGDVGLDCFGRDAQALGDLLVEVAASDVAENLTLACRNAVLNMMELLQERGFTRQQAYVICSVAVDLRISNVVDVPNYVVSALLPEAIFDGA